MRVASCPRVCGPRLVGNEEWVETRRQKDKEDGLRKKMIRRKPDFAANDERNEIECIEVLPLSEVRWSSVRKQVCVLRAPS